MSSVPFAYNARARRYRNIETGRFVSVKVVRAAVDTVIRVEAVKLKALAFKLNKGEINFAEWQLQSMAQIKALHVSMGLAANGGLKNASQSDLGYIGSLVKEQYKFFRNMVKDIRQGKQSLDGSLLARVGLYAQASRGTYEKAVERAAKSAGATESKSELGVADHCAQCVSEASRGWVAIGSLIPIGERTCLQNCHCMIVYR
jgi:hypothetical protein